MDMILEYCYEYKENYLWVKCNNKLIWKKQIAELDELEDALCEIYEDGIIPYERC